MGSEPDLALSTRAAVRLLAAVALLVTGLAAADWLLAPERFPVRSVRFEGPFRHVSREELEAAVLDLVRGNFLRVDLAAVQARVEQIPWVHRAEVRRVPPRDIAIRFTEQTPVARWGEAAYLNEEGEVVHLRGADLPAGPRLAGPSGSAPAVLAQYRRFARLLAPAGLEIAALEMTARRSWRVELVQGFTLVLGRGDAERALARFARVYPSALAAEAGRIQRVDLRYTNGFAVAWRQDARTRGE
jgi:cell division protein FtsQ